VQLTECDQQLEKMLKNLARNDLKPDKPKRNHGKPKNAPKFDARTLLLQMCGVDLTRIDGIDVTTAFKVLADDAKEGGGRALSGTGAGIGADLSRFKDAKHFASWLGLCPGTKISGGKIMSAATHSNSNRAAQSLKMAAISLRSSQSALGAYYRRLCARMDKGKAVTACAHLCPRGYKLARLICDAHPR